MAKEPEQTFAFPTLAPELLPAGEGRGRRLVLRDEGGNPIITLGEKLLGEIERLLAPDPKCPCRRGWKYDAYRARWMEVMEGRTDAASTGTAAIS